MAELGIAAPQGRDGIKQLLAIIADDEDSRLPVDARASLNTAYECGRCGRWP